MLQYIIVIEIESAMYYILNIIQDHSTKASSHAFSNKHSASHHAVAMIMLCLQYTTLSVLPSHIRVTTVSFIAKIDFVAT